ncbi:hypothetical protein [Alkalicoccus daliensis]|uniref:Alkyl hydroperoxide reductase subunit C/ Thiol specific antioxidant domain-containing protein n=1 Tax=Alkalicoccus daliensis TaxID=745820 RepID=A0A1H0HTC5_9BACI|nr:hypothetical protein SAMN04488053_10932 [Alkalicoccus daliensis]
MSEFKLGQQVPEISLPAASGETYHLSEDQKKREGWRFIVYFRGSW